MMFVIAGAAGLDFVSSGFVGRAQAQEEAPAEAPAPVGEAAPTDPGSRGAAGEAAQVEKKESGEFPPFNSEFYASQLFWLVVIFGLFYSFLKRVAMPRVGGIIATREGRIAEDLDQAGRAKTEADAAVAAYEQALAEARAKAAAIGQQARDAAKADAEAERRRVEAGLDARLSEAQSRIDAIKASAMGEVGGIAVETTEAIVKALTGRDIDRASVDAAVSRSRS